MIAMCPDVEVCPQRIGSEPLVETLRLCFQLLSSLGSLTLIRVLFRGPRVSVASGFVGQAVLYTLYLFPNS